MSTKEKHLESYNRINKGYYTNNDILNYKKLIEEHFNNPHLKFEELKEGMWVWDDEYKQCIKIKLVFMPCKEYQKGSLKIYHNLNEDNDLDFVEFEETRFFPVQMANVGVSDG